MDTVLEQSDKVKFIFLFFRSNCIEVRMPESVRMEKELFLGRVLKSENGYIEGTKRYVIKLDVVFQTDC